MKINTSRTNAVRMGLISYHGKPCKNCNTIEKLVVNHSCIHCRKDRQNESNRRRWLRIKKSGQSVELSRKAAPNRKKYYDKNKSKMKEKLHENKRTLGDFYIKHLLSAIKSKCKKKGIRFDLSVSDIVIPELCPVLNIPLQFNVGLGANDNSPSIDRITPSMGYIPSNVIVVSRRANKIKNDATSNELFLVYDFYKDKC